MENDENENLFIGNPVMEAVSTFLKVFSKANISEEDKVHMFKTVFESLCCVPKEVMESQEWKGKGSSVHADIGHEEGSENDQQKVTEEGTDAEKVSMESMISALIKAGINGCSDLKIIPNAIPNLQACVPDGSLELGKIKSKGFDAMEEQNPLPIDAEKFSDDRKEGGSSNGGDNHQGPAVTRECPLINPKKCRTRLSRPAQARPRTHYVPAHKEVSDPAHGHYRGSRYETTRGIAGAPQWA